MRQLLVLGLLCILFSCSEKLIEKPDGLIPKDKMVNILYDLALLSTAQNTNAAPLRERNITSMDFVFSKYGIDSIQFAQSDLYYASRPVEYEAIYTQIVARLEEDQKRLEEIRTKGPEGDKKEQQDKPVKTER